MLFQCIISIFFVRQVLITLNTPRLFTRVIDKMRFLEEKISIELKTKDRITAREKRPDDALLYVKTTANISSRVTTCFNRLTAHTNPEINDPNRVFKPPGPRLGGDQRSSPEILKLNHDPTHLTIYTKQLQTFLKAFSKFGSAVQIKICHKNHVEINLLQEDFVAQFFLPHTNV